MKRSGLLLSGIVIAQLLGCVSDELDTSSTADPEQSFEEFAKNVYRETGTGIMIVNGDEVVADEAELYAFWERMQNNEALIVNKVMPGLPGEGGDDVWNATQKRNITYCVQNAWGDKKQAVVDAVNAAAAEWEAVADVNFVYTPFWDGFCNLFNPFVVFRVAKVDGQQYVARAFFPSLPGFFRDLAIDATQGWNLPAPITLKGVITHELGHTLGFRHEHTRPEAATCFEDLNWRPLTPYDRDSTMHYPQCNGNRGKDLTLSDLDKQGVRALYGAPR